MRAPYLASELLTDVKAALHLPENGAPIDDSTILRIADRVIAGPLATMLLQSRGEYLLTYEDFSATILDDAYTETFLTLPLSDGVGRIHRVEWFRDRAEDALPVQDWTFEGGRLRMDRSEHRREGWYRVYFHAQPVALSATASYVQITGYGYPDVFLSDQPATWSNTHDLQFLSSANPHTMNAWCRSNFVSGISGAVLTFTVNPWQSAARSSEPWPFKLYDYMVSNWQSPIVQVPAFARNWLVQHLATEISAVLGDKSEIEVRQRLLAMAEKDVREALRPRADGRTNVYVPPGRYRRNRRYGL